MPISIYIHKCMLYIFSDHSVFTCRFSYNFLVFFRFSTFYHHWKFVAWSITDYLLISLQLWLCDWKILFYFPLICRRTIWSNNKNIIHWQNVADNLILDWIANANCHILQALQKSHLKVNSTITSIFNNNILNWQTETETYWLTYWFLEDCSLHIALQDSIWENVRPHCTILFV